MMTHCRPPPPPPSPLLLLLPLLLILCVDYFRCRDEIGLPCRTEADGQQLELMRAPVVVVGQALLLPGQRYTFTVTVSRSTASMGQVRTRTASCSVLISVDDGQRLPTVISLDGGGIVDTEAASDGGDERDSLYTVNSHEPLRFDARVLPSDLDHGRFR